MALHEFVRSKGRHNSQVSNQTHPVGLVWHPWPMSHPSKAVAPSRYPVCKQRMLRWLRSFKKIIQGWLTFGLFHWIFLGRLLSLEIPMEASEVGNDGSRQGTPKSVWCLFNWSYFWSLNTSIMMGQTEQTHREVDAFLELLAHYKCVFNSDD